MKSKDSEKPKYHKLSVQAIQSENIIIDQAPEKSKKKKVKGPAHPEQHHDTLEKRRNKRERKDAEEQEESVDHKAQLEESEPPRKKHKNRTSFADPREDMQLNTRSRKGTYCGLSETRWILIIIIHSSRVRIYSDEPPVKMEIQQSKAELAHQEPLVIGNS